VAQGLLERAENLAPPGSPVSLRIKESLSAVQRGAGVYENLQPVKDAPPLWSFNGFGLRIYGSTDVDPDTGSYLTTYYLTALFIPLIPICRYRVIALEEGKYLFLGRAPLRVFDRWHLGLALAGLLAVLIALSVSSNSPPSSEPYGANEETLSVLESEIESGRARIRALEAELRAVDAELADLGGRHDDYQARIRSYEQQAQLGVLTDTYGYNQALSDHNVLVPRYNTLFSRRERLYGEYESLIGEVNRLVNQHNALLGE
jgi:hypothetical protein